MWKQKLRIASWCVLLIAMVVSCSDDVTNPVIEPEAPIAPVDGIVTSDGGEVRSGDYALELPPSATRDTVWVHLEAMSDLDTDSLAIGGTENHPLSVSMRGGVSGDTMRVHLPASQRPDYERIVAVETEGGWTPVEIVQASASGIIVQVPPAMVKVPNAVAAGDRQEVAFNVVQFWCPSVKTSLEPADRGQTASRPAVVLVHGTFADNDTWDDELIQALQQDVGDVWLLEYSWRRSFNSVAKQAVQLFKDRLSGRHIFIVAHSKGGLVARTLVKLMDAEDTNIDKAVFLGTPHYGVSFTGLGWGIVLTAAVAYWNNDPLCTLLNPWWPGLVEQHEGALSLSRLNSHTSLNARPEYLNILGSPQVCSDIPLLVPDPSDCVVEELSTDLAAASHEGEREAAIFRRTLHVNENHLQLNGYSPAKYQHLKAFLTDSEMQATVTYDNFYGMYIGGPNGEGMRFIGGDSGSDDWYQAESYSFIASEDEYIYVFGWNEALIMGLLSQFQLPRGLVLTGPEWQVADPSGISGYTRGTPPPSSEFMSDLVATLNTQARWGSVIAMQKNDGSHDWSIVPGISHSAYWIYKDNGRETRRVLVYRLSIGGAKVAQ